MGREVRMVPANWQHPKDRNWKGEERFCPQYDSLDGGYQASAAEWDEGWRKWQEGLCKQYGSEEKWGPIDPEYRQYTYTAYAGSRPSPDDYMPEWPDEERTHYMMYEDTSEGTPISPAFETPEELARWLTDNGASSFGSDTATYDQWLSMIKATWAPSMVMVGGELKSGVESVADE